MEKSTEENKTTLEETVHGAPKVTTPTRNFKFDPEWVQVLINLRMKYAKLFTRHRNSASDGWKLVYEELKESGAPQYITMANIKKKWMNLMARFRQIKNSVVDDQSVTWPYFEQINRAFGTKYSPKPGEDLDKKSDSSLLNAINNDERQNFIRKLIELRYNHRHLFTGKKYTARYGWMIIRTLLQCEDRYSVEQLSKCWQNLVQRYKQLLRHESTVNITWPYFQLMHNWFSEDTAPKTDGIKSTIDSTQNIIEGELGNLNEKTEENEELKIKISREIVFAKLSDQINNVKIKQDLLNNEILRSLKNIEHMLTEHTCVCNNTPSNSSK
ncbi:unnamed protein product [Brassicogethes aeneus]|uniref:Myb/SANT-like DNA-binding domain-containing protein n=1 Tax=Brassicogethes aeneus TaxID=1431903 RepID=A0A9P0BAG9_BRAAE|nr:unnamed protein product [Brassicogethes aeneus]